MRKSNGSPNGRAMKSTPTGSFAGIGPNLVALAAVAAADRGDVVNQILIVSHIKRSLPGRVVPRILTDQGRIRLASVKIRGPFSA